MPSVVLDRHTPLGCHAITTSHGRLLLDHVSEPVGVYSLPIPARQASLGVVGLRSYQQRESTGLHCTVRIAGLHIIALNLRTSRRDCGFSSDRPTPSCPSPTSRARFPRNYQELPTTLLYPQEGEKQYFPCTPPFHSHSRWNYLI